MRKHFTLPTVLSVLALVVALSGTAVAATSVLIKQNSQVAAHTIAGAAAPKHDNKNIIAGSIGSTDLHVGAVTNTKLGSSAVKATNLASGAVTSAKIAAAAVTRAKLSFPTFSVTKPKTDDTERTLVSTDGLSLTYKCSADFGNPQLAVFISSSDPAAYANGEVNDIDNDTTTQVHTALSSSDQSLTASGTDAGTADTVVTLTYQAGIHVGLVTLDATANVLTSTCTVQGAFVPLT
jgi:hypothetical protein